MLSGTIQIQLLSSYLVLREKEVREEWERWSGSVCPVAYKKSIMVRFYQFGHSQMDPGVNGQHQRAISSDLIYGWEISLRLCVSLLVCVHSVTFTSLKELTVINISMPLCFCAHHSLSTVVVPHYHMCSPATHTQTRIYSLPSRLKSRLSLTKKPVALTGSVPIPFPCLPLCTGSKPVYSVTLIYHLHSYVGVYVGHIKVYLGIVITYIYILMLSLCVCVHLGHLVALCTEHAWASVNRSLTLCMLLHHLFVWGVGKGKSEGRGGWSNRLLILAAKLGKANLWT